jgi:hypothetical protein
MFRHLSMALRQWMTALSLHDGTTPREPQPIEPLDHPCLKNLSLRELADLPLRRSSDKLLRRNI